MLDVRLHRRLLPSLESALANDASSFSLSKTVTTPEDEFSCALVSACQSAPIATTAKPVRTAIRTFTIVFLPPFGTRAEIRPRRPWIGLQSVAECQLTRLARR